MVMKLVVKDDHSIEITGTKELVPGRCNLVDPRMEDGRLEFDYDSSGTEMFWDDQYQVRNVDHERIFLDDNNREYLESEVELVKAGPQQETAGNG